MRVNRVQSAPPFTPGQQAYFPPNAYNGPQAPIRRGGLPAPHELASRIEEAKTSGKLLTQVLQSTAPSEVLRNDLIREFAERCQSASRSLQGYINADDPAPDEETLLTLIETNDGLAAALSKHSRAVLQARKLNSGTPPAQPSRPPQIQTQDASQPSIQTPALPTGRSALVSPLDETPVVAKAGPPPTLSMPKPPERLENPFDDKHGTEAASGSKTDLTTQNNGTASRASHDDDSDDDSVQGPRQYKF
jgi:hypothetical protein